MQGFAAIVQLTLREARRRRIVLAAFLCGLAFVAIFATSMFLIERELQSGLDLKTRTSLAILMAASLYVAHFLVAVTAIVLPLDTLSGEIASGVIHTLVSKPVHRSTVVLGKWAAHVMLAAAFAALVIGGVLVVAWLIADITPRSAEAALALSLLEIVLIVTLAIAGGTRLSTVVNGIVVFGLFGLAFIAGWIEQVGVLAGNDTARHVGIGLSLLSPNDALWRLATYHLQPIVLRNLPANPFLSISVASYGMVIWAVGYIAVVLVLGLRHFARRSL
jgi:Cu-processing system permease protein